MKSEATIDIESIMLDTDPLERALHRAVTAAMVHHKRLGNSIVVWREGKVVRIPPDEIQVPEDVADAGTRP